MTAVNAQRLTANHYKGNNAVRRATRCVLTYGAVLSFSCTWASAAMLELCIRSILQLPYATLCAW